MDICKKKKLPFMSIGGPIIIFFSIIVFLLTIAIIITFIKDWWKVGYVKIICIGMINIIILVFAYSLFLNMMKFIKVEWKFNINNSIYIDFKGNLNNRIIYNKTKIKITNKSKNSSYYWVKISGSDWYYFHKLYFINLDLINKKIRLDNKWINFYY